MPTEGFNQDDSQQFENEGQDVDQPADEFVLHSPFIEEIRYNPYLEVYRKYSKYRIYIEALFQLVKNTDYVNFAYIANPNKPSAEPYDLNVDMIIQIYLMGIPFNEFEGRIKKIDPLMFKTWFAVNKGRLRATAEDNPTYNMVLDVIERSITVLNKEGLMAAQLKGGKASKANGRHTSGKGVEQDPS